MSERILCVDDDPKVLSVYQGHLEAQFDIDFVDHPEKGLAAIKERGPFAVVVSDMHMPGMNGLQFLQQVRLAAPLTVRMLLTGDADHQAAIAAINEGNVFQFLSKPCPLPAFAKALNRGIQHYRLVKNEKELLEGTLRGSIQVLTEVLALVSPLAFGRAERVKRIMQHIAKTLSVENAWQFEVAGLLSQLGCVTLPESILSKIVNGTDLLPRERVQVEAHPRLGADLIRRIPRLEAVADIVSHQEAHFDNYDSPSKTSKAVMLGARALKASLDFDSMQARCHSAAKTLAQMRARKGWYDPAVLEVLESMPPDLAGFTEEVLAVRALRSGMILNEDLKAPTGRTLARRGFEVTDAALLRLDDFVSRGIIGEQVHVLVPPPR